MQNKFRNAFLAFTLAAPIGVSLLSGCTNYSIVVANFESYMNQDLMDDVSDNFGCQFLYYDTNETIETKFAANYDIAIPSSYECMTLKKKGLLSKIDWSAFEMKAHNDDLDQDIDVQNADDAYWLFSDAVRLVIDAQNSLYQDLGYLASDESILTYGIPYFLQDWLFAYDGCDAIEELENEDITWNEAAKIIGNHPWFKRDHQVNIACVDDSRTFYGMSKLAYDQKTNVDPELWNVNPSHSKQSIDEYAEQYDAFISNFDANTFYFNSDSNQILLSLSDPSGGTHSAFCYNGDAIYALLGGGIDGWDELWNVDNYHVVIPKETVITLDLLVFNKKNDVAGLKDKKSTIYEIAKRLVLEGGSVEDDITEYDDDSESYVCGPMWNFDYVLYTPPLRNIDLYVREGDYLEWMDENKRELFLKLYTIHTDPEDVYDLSKLFEIPLDDLDKSNMHWAYEPEKEKL
ncbi:MAG: hypothetical protein HUJ52_01730 [Malacoplasma sp.]|nr:hypothetical protein [Malacoplasma sp.]